VPSALKAAEAPLRVLAGAAATDPQLTAQAELALRVLQGSRAQVEQQTQQEAAMESTAQLMQEALSVQGGVCGMQQDSSRRCQAAALQRLQGCVVLQSGVSAR